MPVVHWLGIGVIAAADAYVGAALLAVLLAGLRRARAVSRAHRGQPLPGVSVLKPLHGSGPCLYENLRGVCQQAYPDYQLVFGLRDPDDPAVAIVQRLQQEFPQLPIDMEIDERIHGVNLKVSNLINMLPHASHDRLVIADADIRVPTDYLTRVTAPLANADVGIVTCLYRGIAGSQLWSHLGRLFIDDWFTPSVQLACAFGSTRFGFGSTIALRRDTLLASGGFEALRNTLADDFWLGELTRRAGLRTVPSELMVGTQISETRLSSLWTHELRWMRTIRAITPVRFVMTCVCFTSPLLLLGILLAPGALAAALVIPGIAIRLTLHLLQHRSRHGDAPWQDVFLIPLRDVLLLAEWAAALCSWRVRWNEQILHAQDSGSPPHT